MAASTQTRRTANRSSRAARGQGLTEVLVVVGMLAIGTVMAATSFGDTLRGVFGTSSDELGGSESATGASSLDGAHQRAANRKGKKTVKDFAQSDSYAPMASLPRGATGKGVDTSTLSGASGGLGGLGGLGLGPLGRGAGPTY